MVGVLVVIMMVGGGGVSGYSGLVVSMVICQLFVMMLVAMMWVMIMSPIPYYQGCVFHRMR